MVCSRETVYSLPALLGRAKKAARRHLTMVPHINPLWIIRQPHGAVKNGTKLARSDQATRTSVSGYEPGPDILRSEPISLYGA